MASTRAVFEQYCVGCHNGTSRAGGLAAGNTALHAAAAEELEHVVEYLIEAGANRGIRNKAGNTALDDEWLEFKLEKRR